YITVVEPFIRSLWSLEAANANASDVFVFWCAVGATLNARIHEPELVRREVANQVVAIFNKRYSAFFSNEFYFVAFMMDPSDGLRLVLPAQGSSVTIRPSVNRMPFNAAYQRVKEYLKSMLKAMLHVAATTPEKGDPLLVKLGAKAAANELKIQVEAWWRRAGLWQFDTGLSTENPLEWWESIAKHTHGRILGLPASTIFSALINSMPDERTNSNITWLNSAIRGSQQPRTIMDHVAIRQWYTKHDVREQ
ncbi:hypothetical protein DFP72DRAFT_759510, partial [Ephemerocybe angulata]